MYADLYPSEVAGMILVDAGHEDQLKRFPPEFEKLEQQTVSYFAGGSVLARFGILRLMGRSSGGVDSAPPYVLKLPKDIQLEYMAMLSHPSYFSTAVEERRLLPETGDQVRAAKNLGDLPLIVLTAESTVDPETLQTIGMPADFDASGIQQIWYELQAELAALSTRGEQIIVRDSTHAIHLDQPQVVIDSIRKIVAMSKE
jgi:pimeloyl-ACP methyl ester carboxylesterase